MVVGGTYFFTVNLAVPRSLQPIDLIRSLDQRFSEETMNKRPHTKIVREGQYIAEVEVELIDSDEGWSPYLSLDDAFKLDDVRAALRSGDLRAAGRLGRVFTLTPVAV